MVEWKTFLANPNHQHCVSQWWGLDCSANNKKIEFITSIQVYLIPWMNFDYKENGGKKRFSCEFKASISSTLLRRTWLQCLYHNEWKLLQVSMFDSFQEWTLITWKMVERKAFLANPKLQYHVSQCGERDCSANNKKNREFYEYPCLSHFVVNFDYMENGGKKSFSYKFEASILCIPIKRALL